MIPSLSKTAPYIAILRNDHMGDLILTTGLVRNLALAGWKVDVICKATWQPVFAHSPHTRAFGLGEDGVPSARDYRSLGSWLRSRHYSHLLIPHEEDKLRWASFFSGVPARWSQFGRWHARLSLHRCIPSNIYRNPRHLADVWLDFARAQGLPVDDGHPELFLTHEERDSSRRLVDSRLGHGYYFVIHPFHGKSSCNWRLEKYVELAARIMAETDARLIITGGAGERSALKEFSSVLNDPRIWVSCGELDLRQFFAVIGGAKALICSSTGALHVSSALDVPSLSLFCPHPNVNQVMWRSFQPQSLTISPPQNACPRFTNPAAGCRDCSFPEYPRPDDVCALLRDKF